nr:MAG TPA: hypothetical protein [Caudoviricetes sp.]
MRHLSVRVVWWPCWTARTDCLVSSPSVRPCESVTWWWRGLSVCEL